MGRAGIRSDRLYDTDFYESTATESVAGWQKWGGGGGGGGERAGNINFFHKRNQTRSPLFAVQPPTLMTEIGRILKEEEEEEEKKEPSSPQRN